MTDNQNDSSSSEPTSKLVGLLAQFDDPGSLVSACNQAREDGYKVMDAYSPFPVHGIDPAIGIKRTILPFIVLAVALGGCVAGVGMQWYTNGGSIFGVGSVESPMFPGYPFKIGGKPFFSLPANIPVTFEIIVLSSAFATFLGMWFMNKLPMLSNPLHRVSRFKRVTNDKFFLMIESKDPKFDRGQTESQLNQWGAVSIDECRQDLTDTRLPSWLKMAGIVGAIALLLPPVMIFRAMGGTNRAPRYHVVPDMDYQYKYKAQVLSPVLSEDHGHKHYLFADQRAARAPVDGSISWGHLDTDTEFYQGIKKDYKPGTPSAAVDGSAGTFTSAQPGAKNSAQPGAKNSAQPGAKQADDKAAVTAPAEEDLSQYVTTFPEGVDVNQELLARGQNRFNIYCSVCHGYAGNGDGLVNQRAVALGAAGEAAWTAAKSLHEPDVMDPQKNPIGRIFDTISHGRNTMGPYASQIPEADRWAIVAYVKALQETGIKPPSAGDVEKEK